MTGSSFDFKAAVAKVAEMGGEQFEATRARLQRILKRVGWTIHLRRKPSGYYAYAAKRNGGKLQDVYIAPLHKIDNWETGKIVAMLPMACYHAEEAPDTM